MQKKTLTVEEVQKTLADSMMSMQASMEEERKIYKSKLTNLEKIIQDKENLIRDLTKKKPKDLIKILEQENEKLKRNYNAKELDYNSLLKNISQLNSQIEIKNQVVTQVNNEKKILTQKIDETEKKNIELNEKIQKLELIIKEVDNLKIEINKYKEEIKIKDETIKK